MVHLVFYMFMLRKLIGDLSSIVPSENIDVEEDMTFEQGPVEILDWQVKSL